MIMTIFNFVWSSRLSLSASPVLTTAAQQAGPVAPLCSEPGIDQHRPQPLWEVLLLRTSFTPHPEHQETLSN